MPPPAYRNRIAGSSHQNGRSTIGHYRPVRFLQLVSRNVFQKQVDQHVDSSGVYLEVSGSSVVKKTPHRS